MTAAQRRDHLFLHEGPHPSHGAWARSVGCTFVPTPLRLRSPGQVGSLGSGSPVGALKAATTRALGVPLPMLLQGLGAASLLGAEATEGVRLLIAEGRLEIVPATVAVGLADPPRPSLVLLSADPILHEVGTTFPPRWRVLYDRLLERVDLVVCNSALSASWLPPVLSDRALVLYPPLPRAPPPLPLLPARPGHRCVALGELNVATKGIDRTLAAFALVRANFHDATLDLIGGGSVPPGSPMEGVTAHGIVPSPEPLLAHASVLLHLARKETYGLAPLEAMLQGVVPVVSPTCGIAPLVAQVDARLVVDDVSAAAATVRWLWEDPQAWRHVARSAITLARQRVEESSPAAFAHALHPFLNRTRPWPSGRWHAR